MVGNVFEALQEVHFVDLGDEAIAALQKELAAQGQPSSPALPPFSSSVPLVAQHTAVAPQVPLGCTIHYITPMYHQVYMIKHGWLICMTVQLRSPTTHCLLLYFDC